MARGVRANRRGRTLENAIADLLSEEYGRVTPARIFALRALRQPIFTEQCAIGRDIYGKNRRVDFLLYHPQRWPDCLVVQCKWQASPGSVEEKHPFEVLSIQLNEFDTIIVLDGIEVAAFDDGGGIEALAVQGFSVEEQAVAPYGVGRPG